MRSAGSDLLAEDFAFDLSYFDMKLVLFNSGNETSKGKQTYIGVHKCNETDWNNFPRFQEPYKVKIKKLKELNVMMCINIEERKKLKLWGKDENTEHQTLEFMMTACKPGSINNDIKCLQNETTHSETMN